MADAIIAYRVQDHAGRGPYRPGTTDRWADPDGPDWPPIMTDFGMDWLRDIPAGWAAGCAFRTIEGAARWFSAAECDRLAQLGYALVALSGCRVVRENARQMIVARPMRLRVGAVLLPWPHRTPAALDPWKMMADA